MEDESMEMDFSGFMADDTDQVDTVKDQEETKQEPETLPTGDDQQEKTEEGAPEEKQESESTEPFLTIKHLGEQKGLTQEEAVTYAQKGADYDRVKQQLTESRTTLDEANKQIAEAAEPLEFLKAIAKLEGSSLVQVAEQMYYNYQKANGVTESEAKKSWELERLQKQVANFEANKPKEETVEERASREVAQFREKYPTVELTDDLIQKLSPMVQNGMSMLEAYRESERARVTEELEALKKELAAERQNKQNQTSAMGSQKDSGGARNQDVFDDFLKNF